MATQTERRVVYAAGMVQGIALVTFPAASTILTDPSEYDLTNTQYGALFLPQVATEQGWDRDTLLSQLCRKAGLPVDAWRRADCRAHELDNLYVVDTSVFPSIGAVNPALTAMANSLRVGDHLLERLGASSAAAAAH